MLGPNFSTFPQKMHPLWGVNIHSKFHDNLASCYWNMLLWVKANWAVLLSSTHWNMMPMKIQVWKEIWRAWLPKKAIIKYIQTEMYSHKWSSVLLALTFLLLLSTSWTALAWLASIYVRPLAITLSGQSMPLRVCVCVWVSQCGGLANGISLIHSINSFYFLDFFFSSPSTQFI